MLRTTIRASAAVLLVLALSPALPQTRGSRSAIIDLTNGADHALLVGGWNGRRWVKDEAFHGGIRGGERYRFYGFSSRIGEATGGKAKLSEASGSAWQIEVKHPPKSSESTLGLTGGWDALPRKPQVAANVSSYRSLVAQVLKQHGLKNAAILVTRAIRVDLDGDGTAEEIISATSPRLAHDAGEAFAHAEEMDYSLVLVRSQRGTTVLSGGYWYVPKPSVTPTINEIGGALDLNGDGKLEIIVRTRYYEGGGVRVYTFAAGKPHEVLYAIDGA